MQDRQYARVGDGRVVARGAEGCKDGLVSRLMDRGAFKVADEHSRNGQVTHDGHIRLSKKVIKIR